MHLRHLLPILALALATAACDPSIGAQGTVTLGPTVSADGFTSLEVRAMSTTSDTFDVSAPFPTDPTDYLSAMPLENPTFPADYDASTIGTSSNRHWRVVAFLTNSAGTDTIASGAWYGWSNFDLKDCGWATRDYCQVSDVDVTLDQQAE